MVISGTHGQRFKEISDTAGRTRTAQTGILLQVELSFVRK